MVDPECSNWQIYGFSVRYDVVNLLFQHLLSLAWNLGCGFAQNESQLLVFRFLAGIGGSAPLVVWMHLCRLSLIN